MAAILNFTRENGLPCEQGATFQALISRFDSTDSCPPTKTAVDFTGFTVSMAVRKSYQSTTPLFEIDNQTLGGITLVASADDNPTSKLNSISILVASTLTATFPAGRYIYDIQVNSGANVYRLYEGAFEVTAQVRR